MNMMKKSILTLAAVAALGTVANVNAMAEKPAAGTSAVSAASTAELEHRASTLQTGMLALETSKLALDRATNPLVKQFAQAEVAEQTTMAEVLKSMYPDAPAITLNTANTDKLNQLKAAGSTQFDRMYVAGQLEGHKQLLDIQNKYIDDARNREEQNVAKLARGQIREHLMILQAFQQRIK